MMEVIEGPHITFLPLAAGADAGTIVVRARRVVASFVALGRTQDQVVISVRGSLRLGSQSQRSRCSSLSDTCHG